MFATDIALLGQRFNLASRQDLIAPVVIGCITDTVRTTSRYHIIRAICKTPHGR